MRSITLNAYAKINLSLDILGRRADGYHDIESIMQGVDLYDVITVEYDEDAEFCVELRQNVAGLPTDDGNLAVRGAKAIAEAMAANCVSAPDAADAGSAKNCQSASAAKSCEIAGSGHTAKSCEIAGSGHTAKSCEIAGSGHTAKNCEIAGGGHTAKSCGAVRITIDKRLPIAAGIAGGSGNAAAVMLGINALAGYPFGMEELMTIGAKVGADVPFSIFMNACRNKNVLAECGEAAKSCEVSDSDGSAKSCENADGDGLAKGCENADGDASAKSCENASSFGRARAAAMTRGIGDIVEAREPIHNFVIMINPGVPVSTAKVYQEIDALPEELRQPTGIWTNMMEKWTLGNVPEAAELHKAMQDNLHADTILMSGSGPTIVAYYSDGDVARGDYSEVAKWANAEWRAWLTETGKE